MKLSVPCFFDQKHRFLAFFLHQQVVSCSLHAKALFMFDHGFTFSDEFPHLETHLEKCLKFDKRFLFLFELNFYKSPSEEWLNYFYSFDY